MTSPKACFGNFPFVRATSAVVALVFLASLSLSVIPAPASVTPRKIRSRVPFVGCASDGQLGPQPAPDGGSLLLPIPASAARQLAYYKMADGLSVLGPRGWHCFGAYGSDGEFLYVSSRPIARDDIFTDEHRFAGTAIEIFDEYGGTSGRFGVAKIIARVFPAYREFTEKVIREDGDIEPASEFPFGPFPGDKLVYRSDELVEYETPPQTEGLGTTEKLEKNSEAIRGLEMLIGEMPEPDLISLAVRLPRDRAGLAPIIIQQVEREAPGGYEPDKAIPIEH